MRLAILLAMFGLVGCASVPVTEIDETIPNAEAMTFTCQAEYEICIYCDGRECQRTK